MLLALLLLAQGQFFTPGCKQGQSCTVATVRVTAAAPYTLCSDTGSSGMISAGQISATYIKPVWCDGHSTISNSLSTTSGGLGYASFLTRILSKTINTGVITTGANLQGFAIMPTASTSGTAAAMAVRDYIITSCQTAGTGAGNMVITLQTIAGSSGAVCTANFPCATASNTPVIVNCTGTISGSLGGFGTDFYGTRLDVSACTTPPAECVVSHDIYGN